MEYSDTGHSSRLQDLEGILGDFGEDSDTRSKEHRKDQQSPDQNSDYPRADLGENFDISTGSYKASLEITLRAVFLDVSYSGERILRFNEVLRSNDIVTYVTPIVMFAQVFRAYGEQILEDDGMTIECLKIILRTRDLRFCRLVEIESWQYQSCLRLFAGSMSIPNLATRWPLFMVFAFLHCFDQIRIVVTGLWVFLIYKT